MRRAGECTAAGGLRESHAAPRYPAGEGSCRRCSAEGHDPRAAHDAVIAGAAACASTAVRRRHGRRWLDARDRRAPSCSRTGGQGQTVRPGDPCARPRRSHAVKLTVILIAVSWIPTTLASTSASSGVFTSTTMAGSTSTPVATTPIPTTSSTSASSGVFTSTTMASSTSTPVATTPIPTTSSTPTPTSTPKPDPIAFACPDGEYSLNHSKFSHLTWKHTFTRSSNFAADDVVYRKLYPPGKQQNHSALANTSGICPPNAEKKPCGPGNFACNCSHQCDEFESCTGHGRCHGKTGGCICDLGWSGTACSEQLPALGSLPVMLVSPKCCLSSLARPSCKLVFHSLAHLLVLLLTHPAMQTLQACKIVFPSTPQDALLWHFGNNGTGAWMGLRNSTTKPTLRVRVGGGGVITQSSNMSDTAYLDISDFPRDSASHSVVVEVVMSPLQVFFYFIRASVV